MLCSHAFTPHGPAVAEKMIQRFRRFRLNASCSNRLRKSWRLRIGEGIFVRERPARRQDVVSSWQGMNESCAKRRRQADPFSFSAACRTMLRADDECSAIPPQRIMLWTLAGGAGAGLRQTRAGQNIMIRGAGQAFVFGLIILHHLRRRCFDNRIRLPPTLAPGVGMSKTRRGGSVNVSVSCVWREYDAISQFFQSSTPAISGWRKSPPPPGYRPGSAAAPR